MAVFLAMIFAPIAGGFFGLTGTTDRVEKREPLPFPARPENRAQFERYPDRLSGYIGDHFPFRAQLVLLHGLLRFWLHSSPSQEILFGKDGWMFLSKSVDVLEQNRGLDVFSTKELDAWIDEMEARDRWCAARGITFYVTVAPNSQTVYPEFLPDYARQVGPETRLQQLVRRLRERHSTLRFIDLRDGLAAAAARERIYHKTDAHWNNLGGFTAYSLIAGRMQQDFPAIRPLARDMYEVRWRTEPGYGLAAMVNLQDCIPEEAPYLLPRFPTPIIKTLAHDGYPAVLQRGMEKNFPTPGGDVVTSLTDQPKIFILRDSFGNWMSLYFAETFHETTLRKHRGGGFYHATKLIEAAKPDIVLYEIVERYLALPLEVEGEKRKAIPLEAAEGE
jgi:hypothetical protein